LWSDWSSLELLRYRDSPRLAASEFATAAASLPSGAVASFALDLPAPLDDASAAALWRRVAAAGVAPSGYLLAPDRPGNVRGWTGPSLRGYRAWDEAIARTDGLATGGSVVAIVGPDAGRAPKAAVTGFVFTAVPTGLVPAIVDATGATTAAAGPVGMSLRGVGQVPL
jgi:hypothetical protein